MVHSFFDIFLMGGMQNFLPAVQRAFGDGNVLPSPSQIIAILIGLLLPA